MAWLRILHRLSVRMRFSDPETAPTISLSRSYRLQENPRCFGCACSPMSPEPKALSPALTSLQGWPSWPIPRYSESCKWRQSHDLVNLSYGSGPGGRWFKSTRPDQFFCDQQLMDVRPPGVRPGGQRVRTEILVGTLAGNAQYLRMRRLERTCNAALQFPDQTARQEPLRKTPRVRFKLEAILVHGPGIYFSRRPARVLDKISCTLKNYEQGMAYSLFVISRALSSSTVFPAAPWPVGEVGGNCDGDYSSEGCSWDLV